jgi:hypothetical protein
MNSGVPLRQRNAGITPCSHTSFGLVAVFMTSGSEEKIVNAEGRGGIHHGSSAASAESAGVADGEAPSIEPQVGTLLMLGTHRDAQGYHLRQHGEIDQRSGFGGPFAVILYAAMRDFLTENTERLIRQDFLTYSIKCRFSFPSQVPASANRAPTLFTQILK